MNWEEYILKKPVFLYAQVTLSSKPTQPNAHLNYHLTTNQKNA